MPIIMKTKTIAKIAMMKKIIPLVACTLLTGCAIIQPRDRVTKVLFLDYRPYVSADFHISPDAYSQPHNALGELMVEVYPAIKPTSQKKKEVKETKFSDGIYNTGGLPASKVYKETITSEELLEIAVSKALELGADGISNFEAKVIYTTTYSKYGGMTQSISHYEIQGLCIDRQ